MEDDMIEVPNNVLIRCPKKQFNLARTSNCTACEHFRGLLDRFPNSDYNFAKRYQVQCVGEPTKRELFELSDLAAQVGGRK